MAEQRDLTDTVLAAWRTNNDVTVSLIQRMPDSLWLKTLGQPHGIAADAKVGLWCWKPPR